MPTTKHIGVREVAAAAGVSRQTVSRVVNDHPSIRPDTRQRVLDVIDKLGYRPNRAARALGTKRSQALGVLIAKNAGVYGPTAALQGISLAAVEADYNLHTVYLAGLMREDIVQGLNLLLDVTVDGVIVIAPQVQVLDVIDEISPNLPYVLMQSRPSAGPHYLHFDQVAGAREATRYLLQLGHRVIAHIAGPQEWLEADARMKGYLEELLDWDVRPLPPILGDWSTTEGYRIGQLLAQRRDITAIFAANDDMAIGVLHALHEANVAVPQNISVIGFDDIPVASHTWPPLTTIRQDFYELGRRCVTHLIGEDDQEQTMTLSSALIIRESTAPVR